MSESKIQQVFSRGFAQYLDAFSPSEVQYKTANSIMNCKTGRCGHNISICDDCGHTDFHSNSCRNRNCPNCQAVLKEVWIDSRRAEVIDAPYFHVVFTVPAELNPLIYSNQELLYSLLQVSLHDPVWAIFLESSALLHRNCRNRHTSQAH